MKSSGDLDEIIKRIKEKHKKAIRDFNAMLEEEAKKITQKVIDDAYREYGAYQVKTIRDIFDSAVATWYDAYDPKYPQEYKRTYGLYDVLDLPINDHDMVVSFADKYADFYDPDLLHGDRKGGDLFYKVFVQGWHGGAESGMKHPNRGTPYYRKPVGRYWYWGSQSVQTKSIYDMVAEQLGAIEHTVMHNKLDQIAHKHNDVLREKIINDVIPRAKAKYFDTKRW